MQKGYKIRIDIGREDAAVIRLDYSARGTLYRSAKVVIKSAALKKILAENNVLDELAEMAGAN